HIHTYRRLQRITRNRPSSLFRYHLLHPHPLSRYFFFFNDAAPTEIYTLSLHDALPTSIRRRSPIGSPRADSTTPRSRRWRRNSRSEEHTSELQSRGHLVCRLLLEKKKDEVP